MDSLYTEPVMRKMCPCHEATTILHELPYVQAFGLTSGAIFVKTFTCQILLKTASHNIFMLPVDAPHPHTHPNPLSELFCIAATVISLHDDVIKWKHFPRYWPFVRGIHR